MSKDATFIDAPAIYTSESAKQQPQLDELDDLSLALVGGGSMTVSL